MLHVISQNIIKIAAAYYHGTPNSRLTTILANGLQPNQTPNWDWGKERSQYVYITDSPIKARNWMIAAFEEQRTQEPKATILLIDPQFIDRKQLSSDGFGDFKYPQPIPAQAIHVYQEIDLAQVTRQLNERVKRFGPGALDEE